MFCKKMVLLNSQENTRARVVFQYCNFIKKETLAHVFSCRFCEIFKNISFTKHLRATTSIEASSIPQQLR